LVAALGAASVSSMIWACGACDEDKVAATYDHAVVDRAMASHYQVVFVAIDGPVSAAKTNQRVVAAALKVRGVVPGSVRTSLAPPAFSFALDKRQEPAAAMADFGKAIGYRSAHLILVRVMRDGVLVTPD
jgi:hypothetical protein